MAANHPVSLYQNSIVNNVTKTLVERPAFIFDRSTGSICKWGDDASVSAYYATITTQLTSAGFGNMAKDYVLVIMDETILSRTEQCYILKRLLEYTATSFGGELISRVNRPDIKAWLKTEMENVPLNLEEA